jgi:hypothetical protein
MSSPALPDVAVAETDLLDAARHVLTFDVVADAHRLAQKDQQASKVVLEYVLKGEAYGDADQAQACQRFCGREVWEEHDSGGQETHDPDGGSRERA